MELEAELPWNDSSDEPGGLKNSIGEIGGALDCDDIVLPGIIEVEPMLPSPAPFYSIPMFKPVGLIIIEWPALRRRADPAPPGHAAFLP